MSDQIGLEGPPVPLTLECTRIAPLEQPAASGAYLARRLGITRARGMFERIFYAVRGFPSHDLLVSAPTV